MPRTQSAVTRTTIHICRFELIVHLPYSPVLVPSDFCLFPNLRKRLAGTHFTTDSGVMAAAEAYLTMKDKAFFQTGKAALQWCWENCSELRGDCWKITGEKCPATRLSHGGCKLSFFTNPRACMADSISLHLSLKTATTFWVLSRFKVWLLNA